MARITLGIGTSHTPLLSLPADLWPAYAEGDQHNPELVFPPDGWTMPYQEGLEYVSPEIKAKFTGPELFTGWCNRCQTSLDVLSDTLRSEQPDVTIIISDDQDEWFYESNMPALSVYWGETAPVVPRSGPWKNPDVARAIAKGYGDVEMDVPVASKLGRFLIEYLMDHEFDVGQMSYTNEQYGGRVARRYPTRDGGETNAVRTTEPHRQGLPHGFSFIIKRLLCNEPGTILPVMQNTCYPPNQVRPKRCFAVGQAIAGAVAEWPEDIRVAVVASGGLSHFVVDEELDRAVLDGLARKDPETLKAIPRKKLYSAASESMNWIALGGVMQDLPLQMELVDYVPVYRTPAGTGGGWAFARWR